MASVVASSSQQMLGGLLLGLSACGGSREPASSRDAPCIVQEARPAAAAARSVSPVLLMGRTGNPEFDGWQFRGDYAEAAYRDLAPHLAAAAQSLRDLSRELLSGLRGARPPWALERRDRHRVGSAHRRWARERARAQ